MVGDWVGLLRLWRSMEDYMNRRIVVGSCAVEAIKVNAELLRY